MKVLCKPPVEMLYIPDTIVMSRYMDDPITPATQTKPREIAKGGYIRPLNVKFNLKTIHCN